MVLIVTIAVLIIAFALAGVYTSRNGAFVASVLSCDPEKGKITVKPVNSEPRYLSYNPEQSVPAANVYVTVIIKHNKYLGYEDLASS